MRVLALALLLCLSSLPARAAELVMFETEGCYWCLQWKTDIGRYYHQTREGRIAPLRLVDLHDPRPPHLRAVRGIAMTPTFVLMDRGREIGRIIGYPGERAFWAMLSRMLGG